MYSNIAHCRQNQSYIEYRKSEIDHKHYNLLGKVHKIDQLGRYLQGMKFCKFR